MKTIRIKIISLAFITFFMIGCSMSVPAVSEYRINTIQTPAAFNDSSCKKQSLKIAQAFSSASLMTHDMNYGQGNYKQYKFSESQWAESPNRAITAEVLEYIQSIKLFKNVQISKSRSRNGVLLETNIEDFMQYFSEDEKESYAQVRINFTLIDLKTSSVIATQTFESKLDVDNINAASGVVSLNKALTNVLMDSTKWLGEVCK